MADGRHLAASEGALTAAYDLAMLDLDGVVYIGGHAVPGRPIGSPRRVAPGYSWPSSPTTRPARPETWRPTCATSAWTPTRPTW